MPRRKPARKPTRDSFAAKLEREKAASVGQLLFKCARLMNEQAVGRIESPPGAPRLRPAHTGVFPHLDLEGTRLTELARRMGISKQAVGQLVDDLEAMGAVERVRDPSDGRAKLIRFSREPGATLLDGLAALRGFEAELEEALGARKMRSLHRDLTALLRVLEARDQARDE